MGVSTAVFLAAGQGARIMPLTKDRPKALLDYGKVPIVKRSIYQLINFGVKRILVVVGFCKEKVIEEIKDVKGAEIEFIENDKYAEDVNIYSTLLAVKKVNDDFLLIEADTIMEDDLVEYITDDKFAGKSVWFTIGKFNEQQYGGILKVDAKGNVVDLKIVPEFLPAYKGYSKLTGLMRIGKNEIKTFRKLLEQYAAKTLKQYYHMPWIDNIDKLPSIEADISGHNFATFNTVQEYEDIINHRSFKKEYVENKIHLIKVNRLRPIEGHGRKKVQNVKEKILNDGKWTKPICVEKNHWLVLDGMHRLEVAKDLGIKNIPAMLFSYKDVEHWPLRPNYKVTIKIICEKALSGNIYPYKSVKHRFSQQIIPCDFELDKLK